MKRKTITILGATGSIGQSTAHVIKNNPALFDVYAVTANSNAEKLAEIAISLNAQYAIIAQKKHFEALQSALKGHNITALHGADTIAEYSGHKVDLVMAAIMGFQGLLPIMNALEQGTNIAVANKEPLVAAGPQIMALAKKTGAKILPVDSEHNAIYQVFEVDNKAAIEKIILTASGGPFLNKSAADVYKASPAEAIAHPNWSMGKKISVDSASMMNKALEIIEAHFLFDLPPEKIDVLIHPQSIIHSMVSYADGSVLSQMGASDMCTPIAYALSYPERIDSFGQKLDFSKGLDLRFIQPDFERFPALKHAYTAIRNGQSACIALNAANEIAVTAFLNEDILFGQITDIVEHALSEIVPRIKAQKTNTIEEIIALDAVVRREVIDYIDALKE